MPVADRVVVTLHLPMEMGAAGRIMRAVAREFPDARVDQSSGGQTWAVKADDDFGLTAADRRRIARGRDRG